MIGKVLYGIYGAGGHGREAMPLAREQVARQLPAEPHEILFIDDSAQDESVNGQRVVTFAEFVRTSARARFACLAIANSSIRERLSNECKQAGVEFFTVRARETVVMDAVRIGDGAILSPYVTLTSNVSIGAHFHANYYSYVAHDCVIGDFVTFAPSVKCNGNVRVEDHAYIGAGAVLKQGVPGTPLVIGRGAIVGMGAVVTKSVPPGETVIGNPARVMRK
jgi:sugar O-acyltransferase (sialic acid O-acetyltransferase NeuD family)